MTTDLEIHSALVRWLAVSTGRQFIKAEVGGDRPALPYGMVNYTGSIEVREQAQEIEFDNEIEVIDEEDVPIIMAAPILEIEWRYSVHAYGPSPADVLRPIRSAYHLAQANEPLMPGLVIHEISQIRDVPDFVNEAWEPRAQMDLFLRGLTRDRFKVDAIEQFSFVHQRT